MRNKTDFALGQLDAALSLLLEVATRVVPIQDPLMHARRDYLLFLTISEVL